MDKKIEKISSKKGNTTTTWTMKTVATTMPCVGKVKGITGKMPIVWLEVGVKGLRTGSILALKQAYMTSDVMQIGRVIAVSERIHCGNKYKVAYIEFLGGWFGSFKLREPSNKGAVRLGNVFISHSLYLNVAKWDTPARKEVDQLLRDNGYPRYSLDGCLAYWMVDEARQLWEQRKELKFDDLI